MKPNTSIRKLDNFPAPMRYIGETVLEHKKDIKFHRGAEHRAGAERYAKKHGLTIGPEDEDINNDGEYDNVLYNKKGVPVMINGWTTKASEYPYRKDFVEKYPRKYDRTLVGGYRGYLHNIWEGHDQSNPPQVVIDASSKGYATKYAKQSKEPSLYQSITNEIRKRFVDGINRVNERCDNMYNWAINVFPFFQALSMVYCDIVLRDLWNLPLLNHVKAEIMGITGDPIARYELFKKRIQSKHFKQQVDNHIASNFNKYVNDVTDDYVDGFLSNILFDERLYVQIPTDEEVNTKEGRATKAAVKEDYYENMYTYKAQLINEIFQ